MISEDKTNTKQQNESKKLWPFVFLLLALVLADLLTKHFAGHIFKNNQFAFSLPLPLWLIYIIYAVVLASIAFYVYKHHWGFGFYAKIAWVLIFAGALCNILERIALGFVRDFIYITLRQWTGVYNLADFYIILGIIILLFLPKEQTTH